MAVRCGPLQGKDRFCQGDRMDPAVMVVAQLVAGVSPGDDREAEDIGRLRRSS